MQTSKRVARHWPPLIPVNYNLKAYKHSSLKQLIANQNILRLIELLKHSIFMETSYRPNVNCPFQFCFNLLRCIELKCDYPKYVDCGQGGTMYGALVMPSLVLDVIPAYMSCGHFKSRTSVILLDGCELQLPIYL